jgi:pimeloyl-ACP methyl ester carboxylesterase
MATLAALGHSVIAIDLPGFGKTRGSVSDKGEYLAQVIDTLSPDTKPVVITPSASGAFIFPLLSSAPDKVSQARPGLLLSV